MKVDFDRLAPEERRLLLVASDERYAGLVRKGAQERLLALGKRFLPFAAFSPAAAIGAASAVWVVRRLRERAALRESAESAPRVVDADEAVAPEALVARGEIPIPHLAPAEAARRFRFDHDLPHDGALYVLDPVAVSRDRYLRPALANERLAQEKVAAFVSIASALGARRIEILSARVDAVGAGARVRSPIPETAAQLGLGVRVDAEGTVTRQVLMELDPPSAQRPPRVPEALRGWLELDPMLRALVETRLEGAALRASFALQVGDLLDLDASLSAELEGRGVSLGGAFRRVGTSTWTFAIEWWPKAE
jgi:hypothetical protein